MQDCTKGKSWRYGLGVQYDDHVKYLASIGLVPERNADGSWVGFDPAYTDPLADPEHPFAALSRPISTAAAADIVLT